MERAFVFSIPLMQGKLADMYTVMNAAKAYVYTVALRPRRGDAQGRRRRHPVRCREGYLDGARGDPEPRRQRLYGYINDYPTGRLLRDAKLYEIGVGTSEIRRMLIGRELFEETA
jgi:isovaleryl-CoA dehydrogenase